MASKQTPNYKLSQWSSTDRVLRSDFNSDNTKLDAALMAKADASALAALQSTVTALSKSVGSGGKNCRVALGTYRGSGLYGSSHPNVIAPGFYPVFLLFTDSDHGMGKPYIFLRPLSDSPTSDHKPVTITWTDTAISWYQAEHELYQFNVSGKVYYYIVAGWDKNA